VMAFGCNQAPFFERRKYPKRMFFATVSVVGNIQAGYF
jgi:hypothetical protein